MHSQKVIKVLGAGLTAAALTLGAAAPALAVINVDTDSAAFTNDYVDVKFGKPEVVRFKIGVTYDSEDRVSFQTTTFSTEGDGYKQELEVVSEDKNPVTTAFVFANAKAFTGDGSTDTLGNKLFTGTWSADTVKQFASLVDERDSTDLDGVTIDVREAAKAEQQVAIDADAINNEGDLGGDAFVSVEDGGLFIRTWGIGNSDKPADNETEAADAGYTVEFVYTDPIGRTYTVGGLLNDDGDRFQAVTPFDVDNPYISGTYKLTEVHVGTVDYFDEDGVIQDALDEDTVYALTTWSIITSADQNLSAGDFTLDQPYNAMLRLYNPNSGEHFYTSKYGEKDLLVEAGWRFEGIGFYAPDDSVALSNLKAIYRLYNGTDHHYATAGEAELLAEYGWTNEGLAFYSDETVDPTRRDQAFLWGDTDNQVAMYRLYNPNATVGQHHYTSSRGERDLLQSAGWTLEGVGFYGIDAENYGLR